MAEDDAAGLRQACMIRVNAFVKIGVDCQIEGATAYAIGDPASACPYLQDPEQQFKRDCWLQGWATEHARANVSRETIQADQIQ